MLSRGAPARDASACGPLMSPGLSLDRSRLHLLYWTPPEAAWDDITAQVALEFTHLYARFQVTHFSWSVPPAPPLSPLPTVVCAAPAHRQPSQVLALVHHQDVRGGPGSEGLGAPAAAQGQPHCPAEAPGPRAGPAAVPAPQQGGCRVRRPGGPSRKGRGPAGGHGHWARSQWVPAPQVDAALQRLLDRYRGPEPSDTVEMFEGEEFFAAFERGIAVDAGMPPAPPLEGTLGSAPRAPC